jgi:hypothetical protein
MRNAHLVRVLRRFAFALVLVCCLGTLSAATLERLSLDDMIAKSTLIVRAKVASSYGAFHGAVIYTHYTIAVSERYKGTSAASTEIIVPGGVVNSSRQQVSGAPQLTSGSEYVLFLWTGPSGYTHIIGLTQGLFSMSNASASDPALVRSAASGTMLDAATGRPVRDTNVTLRLSTLKSRIASVLSSSSTGVSQ